MRVKRGRLIAALCIAAAVISLIMTILGAWERIFELFGYKEDLNSPSAATVSFLSVKAADCCILSSAGRHMMIDCGGDETSGTAVKYMDLNGVERLDILFITHFDSDHSELLPQIAENVEIGKIVTAQPFEDSGEELIACAEQNGIEVEFAEAGEEYRLGGFSAVALSPSYVHDNDNDNSLVLRLEAFGKKMLFTGDISDEVERELLSLGAELDCDILKVAHHGSRHSSSDEFLSAVSAEYAVVSVGDNSYGLPSLEALNRIEQSGARVLRTDRLGSVSFTLTESEITVKTEY